MDATAALAYLQGEPGAGEVLQLLDGSAISAVNWSETLQKTAALGIDPAVVSARMAALGLKVVPFGSDDAEHAARLWIETRRAGLSFADRACLALAGRLRIPALTTDRAWAQLAIDVNIRVIR